MKPFFTVQSTVWISLFIWFLFLPQLKFGEPLDQDSQEVFGWICQFISDFKKVYSEYAQWSWISIHIWSSRCSFVWICTCYLKHVIIFHWEGDWTVCRNSLICRLRPMFSGSSPGLVFGLIKSWRAGSCASLTRCYSKQLISQMFSGGTYHFASPIMDVSGKLTDGWCERGILVQTASWMASTCVCWIADSLCGLERVCVFSMIQSRILRGGSAEDISISHDSNKTPRFSFEDFIQ